MDCDITYVFIDPRGIEEMGVGSGVSRDVYCTFWREVSDSYLIGEKERVPLVRHGLYKPDWQAIGKILVKGYIATTPHKNIETNSGFTRKIDISSHMESLKFQSGNDETGLKSRSG